MPVFAALPAFLAVIMSLRNTACATLWLCWALKPAEPSSSGLQPLHAHGM